MTKDIDKIVKKTIRIAQSYKTFMTNRIAVVLVGKPDFFYLSEVG